MLKIKYGIGCKSLKIFRSSKTGMTSTSPRRQERRSRDRSIDKERTRERREKVEKTRDRSRDSRGSGESRDGSREERDRIRQKEGRFGRRKMKRFGNWNPGIFEKKIFFFF